MGWHVEDLQGLRFFFGQRLGLALGLGPEQAVGNDVAHAGAKASVQAAVQIAERLRRGRGEVAATGDERRERRGQGVARAGEHGFEALEFLAAQHRLRRGQHVVQELVRQRDARDERVGHAHGRGRLRDVASGGTALAAPLRQQPSPQRAVVSYQHGGLR
jgi:hypothetical protein